MPAKFFALTCLFFSSFAFSADWLQEGAFFGLCSPIVDMITHVEPQIIADAGLDSDGFSLTDTLEKQNLAQKIPTFADVRYEAGGTSLNSLRVAQRILMAHPGLTTFVGAAGDDEMLKILEKRTENDGVFTLIDKIPGENTGACAVMIPSNDRSQRSLLTSPGAANSFRAEFLRNFEVQKKYKQAKVFLTSGYFILTPNGFEAALGLAQHAKTFHKIFCLNLAAPFVIDLRLDELKILLEYTDFVFGNEEEGRKFAEKMGWKEEDVIEKLAKFGHKKAGRNRVVIITHGAKPTQAYDGKKKIVDSETKIDGVPVKPISPKDIVDTNGAGDAFIGGFIAKMIEKSYANFDVKEGIEAGHEAARMILQNVGCSFDNFGSKESDN